jgi:hypothetical protein
VVSRSTTIILSNPALPIIYPYSYYKRISLVENRGVGAKITFKKIGMAG